MDMACCARPMPHLLLTRIHRTEPPLFDRMLRRSVLHCSRIGRRFHLGVARVPRQTRVHSAPCRLASDPLDCASMHDYEARLLNTGLYTVPEAARLTRVSVGKIRRWLKGYNFKSGERVRHSDAVWQGELEPIENKLALSFRDLLELRFVDAFIRAGVSWRTMRRAHAKAQEQLKTTHPFCSNRILTDGRRILLRQGEEDSDQALIDLVTDQGEFSRIVETFLKELEFSGTDIVWWPLGRQRQIVLDPKRNFGQPTVARSGVPSQVLARSAKANASQEVVAKWYEVQPDEVRDAVEFEQSLAKAA